MLLVLIYGKYNPTEGKENLKPGRQALCMKAVGEIWKRRLEYEKGVQGPRYCDLKRVKVGGKSSFWKRVPQPDGSGKEAGPMV